MALIFNVFYYNTKEVVCQYFNYIVSPKKIGRLTICLFKFYVFDSSGVSPELPVCSPLPVLSVPPLG